MRKALLSIVILLISFSALAQPRPTTSWPFDRAEMVEKFIYAVYPDLHETTGLITLRVEEFHITGTATSTSGMLSVQLVPCQIGMGHVLSGDRSRIPKKYLQPTCATVAAARSRNLLDLYVTANSVNFPINQVYASGTFFSDQNRVLHDTIAAHGEWQVPDMIDALEKLNPRFGPKHKEEFLKTVPVAAIRDFTGCQLDFSRASFLSGRKEVPPAPPYIVMRWSVPGVIGESSFCAGYFEPFDGRLVQFE